MERELTDAGVGGDELRGVPAGGVPGRVSQPELSECDVVLTPAPAPPLSSRQLVEVPG